jgi:hypothetical protein
MRKHRSPRNRVSKPVPPHNTDDTENAKPVPPHNADDTDSPCNPDNFDPAEALQRLHLEVVQLEAVANATSEAVIQLPYPSDREARRPFERVYALVGLFADGTHAAANLSGKMMDALAAYLQRKHADG